MSFEIAADYSRFICLAFFFIGFVFVSGSATDFTGIMQSCAVRLEFYTGINRISHSLAELETSLSGQLPERLQLVVHSMLHPSQSFRLSLEKNRALLPRPHRPQADTQPVLNDSRFCYYHGEVLGDTSSSSHAAVNLCRGQINGLIFLNGDQYVLESSSRNSQEQLLLVPSSHYSEGIWTGETYAQRQLDGLSQNCDFPSTSHEREEDSSAPGGSRVKRNAGIRRHRQIPGYYKNYLDENVRYVELVLVNDNSLYRKFNFDKDLLEDRGRQIANIVNSLYYPLNIRVSLVGIETWDRGDIVSVTDDADYTLQNFLTYRKSRLNAKIPNDNAQLLTDRIFKSGVVGKALKGTICSFERSGGVTMDHSRRIVSVASTVAHEMGHNFGMEHDNDTCDCPKNQRCIMSASSGGLTPTYWSSCSLEALQWGLEHGGDFCLKNQPDAGRIFDGPICGNGIVEQGEECDCGTVGTCENKCCNATNCRLAEGAECASGGCCDRNKCKLKPSTTTCRRESDECDLPEFCDGKSEVCPSDVHKQNGISCGAGEGFCYNGKCGVKDRQCRLLWGDTGFSSPDICYKSLNTHKNVHGNCGFNRTTQRYSPCRRDDVMCGRLHCVHRNERTEYGDRSVVQTAHTFLQEGGGKYAVCRVAQLDLGGASDEDPGMVPSGTKCAPDKMCSKAKCTPVRKVLNVRPCDPPDCNGVGVCNSRGNCHCNFGYGGPDCGRSGLGGSLDSGPSGPSSNFNVWLGVLIFVFVVFPLLVAALTFLYRKKRHWLAKYKLLRYLLPRNEAKPPNPPSNVSSNNSSPSHRLVFAAKPPPINGIPISEAQELERTRRSEKCLANSEIHRPPPQPPNAALKPTHLILQAVGSSTTLPRSADTRMNFHPVLVSTVADYSDGVSSLTRTPSQRPQKPAPPRPKRPRESVIDQLYAERGSELKDSESSGLLTEVLSALDGNHPLPVPQRRAPQPPLDPEQPAGPSVVLSRPPEQNTPPPDDPGNEEQWTTIDDSAVDQTLSISGPSNPVIGGKIVTKSPELTIVPNLPGNTRTLPSRKMQRTVSSAEESSDGELPGRRVQRSVSSASSSSGRGPRPAKAPPPPPKPAPLVESDVIDDDNYYDVIPTPPEEKTLELGFSSPRNPLPSYGLVGNGACSSGNKPPLPCKPKTGNQALAFAGSRKGSDSRVSALKAKFDQKSGVVKTNLVK